MSIEKFKNLEIEEELISNGIVFVWSHKQILSDLMTIMEQKGFTYIENFAFIHLSAKKIIKFLIEKNTPPNKAKET